MKTMNTAIATENATVYDMTKLFAYVINEKNDKYNVVVDIDTDDSRACKDDYLHIYRHDTQNVSNRAHNNVFKCYFKHKSQRVNIKCNTANFDTFESNTEHIKQYHRSEIRYIVSYSNFIQFMSELMQYDNDRATTTATATTKVEAIAK